MSRRRGTHPELPERLPEQLDCHSLVAFRSFANRHHGLDAA